MDVFRTKVVPSSADFAERVAAMQVHIGAHTSPPIPAPAPLMHADVLESETARALEQGPAHVQARHVAAGKLLPRERILGVLDADTPFLELLALAGCRAKERARTVAGIGIVHGREVMVSAHMATVKGGSTNEHSLRKGLRAMEIARENRLPAIAFVETAGADLTQQARVFHAGGAIFRELARHSALGLPSIAVVCGSSTAGGAYQPGLSDYTILVQNHARVFLAGPPLVKMATGEEVDDETLGGAAMHARVSGVGDYLARNEAHAITLARQLVAHLTPPLPRPEFVRSVPPLYDPEELLGIVGGDLRSPYDAREVIARLVDGSVFHEWKGEYGRTLVCVWALVHGVRVGIMANNGVLLTDSAAKGAHFLELCDRRGHPVIFLQNITGFMVGQRQEQAGIIKAGSLLINAVANLHVPAITVVVGASYGAGNYAMMGRAYQPRFLFSWPASRVAVMGSDQLAGVMRAVGGKRLAGEAAERMVAVFKAKVDSESSAWWITSECLDDGVIDPRDTRTVIALCLSVVFNAPVEPNSRPYGIGRL